MAYIQQQQQTSNDQTVVAMSSSYEIQMADSEDAKTHIVGLANDSGRNESQDTVEHHHLHHQQQPQHHTRQQQQQQQSTSSRNAGHGDCNGAGDDANNLRASSASSSDERQQLSNNNHERSGVVIQSVASLGDDPNASGQGVLKTPNSYKYPLLSKYYQFGPWIGRNRKAICLGCRLQTSSSQPDRLLKHLNKCSALTPEDKVAVQDLMNERTANKRKKPIQLRLRRGAGSGGGGGEESEFYDDDEPNASPSDDLGLNSSQHTASTSGKKHKSSDRKSQIDEALARFIMVCRIPLKAIHSTEFVEFIHTLDPNYHIPSRETITNVLIPGLLNII